MRLENWEIGTLVGLKKKIIGDVYGSDEFSDSVRIITAEVNGDISSLYEGRIVTCLNGTQYLLGKRKGTDESFTTRA